MNLLRDNFERVDGNKISDGIYGILDTYNAIPVAYHRVAKYSDWDTFIFQVMINSNGILSYDRITISMNPFTNEFRRILLSGQKL